MNYLVTTDPDQYSILFLVGTNIVYLMNGSGGYDFVPNFSRTILSNIPSFQQTKASKQ